MLFTFTDAVRAMAEHLPIVVLTNGTLFQGDRISKTDGMDHDNIALQISLDSHLPDVNDMARGEDNFRKVVLNAICWCAHMDVPAGGVVSSTPDLAALQANQDNQPGDRFDATAVQRMLDSFAGKR